MDDKLKAISMHEDTLVLADGDNVAEVTLDETGKRKLQWLCHSPMESVLAYRTLEWDIFFGPYIDGARTGYIFQVINLYSRKVTSVTIPFETDVDINTVRDYLKSLMN